MSSPLVHRLNRLERQRGLAQGHCPSCDRWPRPMRVVFADEPDDGSPSHCPNCGRQLHFVIEFDERG